MLSGLTGSQYINAAGDSVSGGPFINADNPVPAPARGAVRFNNSRLETWDGNYWTQAYGAFGSVSLTADAVEAINWVREKIEMEKRIEQLAKENPAIADAVATVNESLERLQVILALSKREKEPAHDYR
jgi:hypothetical protein